MQLLKKESQCYAVPQALGLFTSSCWAETQAVTEFYGEFGSGKSQICHTLCATPRQTIESGGLDSGVIYIDTKGTFRPEIVECL
ncbi:MAG: hypothetical protein WA667_24900 [Candidatus Nitrosopolaris sp.]